MPSASPDTGGFLKAHLGSRDVSKVIYGAIIGLAIVVALEDHPPSAGVVAATLAATAVAVGLAEIYSEAVGAAARARRRIRLVELRTLAIEAAAVTVGAGFPLVFFVASSAGALELDTAFTLAKWTGLGLVCAYGFLGARLAGAARGKALIEAVAVGAIGGILVAVKALVH